jgi:hypothetical protein
MTALRRWLTTSTVLGVVSGLALFFCVLALTDIGHGEADVSLEWWIVRIGFLIFALFIVTALVTLVKVRSCVNRE